MSALKQLQQHLQRSIFMHAIHYKTLPSAFNLYCSYPSQVQRTRYSSNHNFVLPPVRTIRGQSSIKFAGPKAWSAVPREIKEIAFRKPFTNAMKKHILDTLKENNQNLPENSYLKRKRKDEENRRNRDYLLSLFEENDDDFIFLGFDTQS